ncbi:hypothetical protein KJ966_01680 [bacterium]|nr:hypothetical protein [bacterium]
MSRKPKIYTYRDKVWTLKELEQVSPVGKRTIQKRLEAGWSIRRAVEEPKYNHEAFAIASTDEAIRGCTEEQLAILAEFEQCCQTARWE